MWQLKVLHHQHESLAGVAFQNTVHHLEADNKAFEFPAKQKQESLYV